MMNLVLNKTTF